MLEAMEMWGQWGSATNRQSGATSEQETSAVDTVVKARATKKQFLGIGFSTVDRSSRAEG